MKEPILNLPCKICNKKIKISEGTLIEHRPLHFSCYKNEIVKQRNKEILEIFNNLIHKHKELKEFYNFQKDFEQQLTNSVDKC